MEPYEHLLNTIRPETSLGSANIHVYRPHELKLAQVGYSISPTGKSLVDDQPGGWQRAWLVIGYDEAGGDPLFIDTSKDGYPVYVAMTGKGRWDPVPIANSLKGFANALLALTTLAKSQIEYCCSRNHLHHRKNKLS